jgi:Tol biopolymer transport system component
MNGWLRRGLMLALIAVVVAPVVALNPLPAAAQGTCGTAPAPRLTAGQQARVVVTDGTGNNLRDTYSTTTTVLGVLADGEIFTVLSGPQCAENYWWWQVRRWDGQTGWTAEGIVGEYWVEPWPIVGAKIASGPRPNLPGSLISYASAGADPSAWQQALFDVSGTSLVLSSGLPLSSPRVAWSPDGTRLALESASDLFVLPLQTTPSLSLSAPINLTNSAATIEREPTWSPDGQRIAFAARPNAEGSMFDIYTLALNGGVLTPLTTSPTNDFAPAWSPDGSRIAFLSDRDGTAEIYVMGTDGANPFRVTVNNAVYTVPVVWSPDGRQIAFVSKQADGRQDIYVINVDGSGLIALTTDGKAYHDPVWSPDSQRVAFAGANPAVAGAEALFSVQRDGTDRMQYTVAAGVISGATWSPDGNWIAFAQNGEAGSNADIYAIRSSGINLVNLTNSPASSEIFPVWQPRVIPGVVVTPPGQPTPAATAPAVNPGAQDLLLLYNTTAPAFTLQNVSGKALNLSPITFAGAGLTVPASIWVGYTVSPVESFKSLGCLMIWPFGIPQQPTPAECGDARQGWVENGRYIFWTQGSFTVSYNGVVVATCNTADGRCMVDLP